eukprot:gene14548-19666_t
MGGHALYVWGSIGMCIAAVLVEVLLLDHRRRETKRALAIVSGLAALGIASALVLNAFNSNLVFFFSPTQVLAHEAPRDRSFRIGGLVEEGSLQR